MNPQTYPPHLGKRQRYFMTAWPRLAALVRLEYLLDICLEYFVWYCYREFVWYLSGIFDICIQYLLQKYFMPACFVVAHLYYFKLIWFYLSSYLLDICLENLSNSKKIFVWYLCKAFVLEILYDSLVCGGTCFAIRLTAKNRFQLRVKFNQSLFKPKLSSRSFGAMIRIMFFLSWSPVLMILIICLADHDHLCWWSWLPVLWS